MNTYDHHSMLNSHHFPNSGSQKSRVFKTRDLFSHKQCICCCSCTSSLAQSQRKGRSVISSEKSLRLEGDLRLKRNSWSGMERNKQGSKSPGANTQKSSKNSIQSTAKLSNAGCFLLTVFAAVATCMVMYFCVLEQRIRIETLKKTAANRPPLSVSQTTFNPATLQPLVTKEAVIKQDDTADLITQPLVSTPALEEQPSKIARPVTETTVVKKSTPSSGKKPKKKGKPKDPYDFVVQRATGGSTASTSTSR